MSTAKFSDSDENLIRPLLQQQNDDVEDIVIVNENSENYKETLIGQRDSQIGHALDDFLLKRRKGAFVVLALTLLFIFFNSMLWNRSSERISVNQSPHEPGIKPLKILESIAKEEQVIMKPEHTISKSLLPKQSDLNIANTVTISTNFFTSSNLSTTKSTILQPPPGYLVWSDKCKIRDIDPYTPEVMQFFKRQKYEACSTIQPLTRVAFNSTANQYTLVIDDDQVKNYVNPGEPLKCCYQVIERKSKGGKADKEISLGECLNFESPTQLPCSASNILVKCKNQSAEVYLNGHPMMPESLEIRQRLSYFKQQYREKPVSVLMMGIDSVSRTNIIRAMPKTAQYLYDNKWFEMSGYNKIDDNTFPNIMAILTGYNQSTVVEKCTPDKVGGLDRCPIIWRSFREKGYVTAYAEDESWMSTFSYLKKGFEKPPVDYYLRPFMLSVEHTLKLKKKSGLTFCLGYQHSADFIYDYAYELATRYHDEPYFGLFWANSFSHNDISDSSSMDEKMVEYLNLFDKSGILDQSVVIFFSDHGMRFGPTRKFLSGYFEERLPFMFIWLPPSLKKSHPEFVDALRINKNRLTNPYDVYMTLKHILELSGRVNNLPIAQDCPNCQTLLKPVPHSRSCRDAAIADHWCTCIPYDNMNKSSSIVTEITNFTINYINNYLAEYENGTISDKCAILSLKHIEDAYRSLHSEATVSNRTTETYRVVFKTKPNDGMFEATVLYSVETGDMKITGNISRLNSYAKDSNCVSDGGAKKYCSCSNGPTTA